LSEPLLQHERYLAAAMPNHHFPRLTLQRIDVRREFAALARGIRPAKRRQRAEQPGAHEIHEVEEIVEAILDRRCGQEQEPARPQRFDQFCRRALRVSQAVRLVGDHQIPFDARDLFRPAGAARRCERGDDRQGHAHVHGIADRVTDDGVRPVHAPSRTVARGCTKHFVFLRV
jgi:hypothetical protein